MSKTMESAKNIAVILSGCGGKDGSEVTEATSVLIHLGKHNAGIESFAPHKNIPVVLDHITGKPIEGEEREVMTESARITRGAISDVRDLNPDDFDGLIVPGGLGAAKNLSTYGKDKSEMVVDAGVAAAIKEFHKQGKPMGFICIAPTIAAKLIPGVEVTFGAEEAITESGDKFPGHKTADVVRSMGAKHVPTTKDGVHIDEANKVVSSCAYMCASSNHYDVFVSVGKTVDGVMGLLK